MLKREIRRMVCVHEAGHAVIHAFGGAFINGLAVAPEGSESWTYPTQKGGSMEGLWGACELGDGPLLSMYVKWDDAQLSYRANRTEFDNVHRAMTASLGATCARQVLADLRRFVRLRVCGALAGPIAESYYEEREFDVWEAEGWVDPESDVEIALGIAQLLPYRSEFEHACKVTCEALRRPDIWSLVLALADELERTGNMCPAAIAEFLPTRDFHWPPSAATRWRSQPAVEQ